MRSFAESGRSISIVVVLLIHVAQVTAVAANRVEFRLAAASILLALVGEDADQRRMNVFRHGVGIAADVERRAVLQPRIQIVPGVPQGMLHIPLLVADRGRTRRRAASAGCS